MAVPQVSEVQLSMGALRGFLKVKSWLDRRYLGSTELWQLVETGSDLFKAWTCSQKLQHNERINRALFAESLHNLLNKEPQSVKVQSKEGCSIVVTTSHKEKQVAFYVETATVLWKSICPFPPFFAYLSHFNKSDHWIHCDITRRQNKMQLVRDGLMY